MDRFVYLAQSAGRLPDVYNSIPCERADFIQLTWKEPVDGAIFFPKSTYAQGRNRLLAEAVGRGEPYLYYVFLDDDIVFEKGGWRTFEDAVLKYRPAIAAPYMPDYPVVEKRRLDMEAHTCAYFDATINAFHRDVVRDRIILPYYTGFDDVSWWYNQSIIFKLVHQLYREHTIQVNTVVMRNANHGQYPQGDDWTMIEKWFKSEVELPDEPGAVEKVRRKVAGQLRQLLRIPAIAPEFRPPRPPGKPPQSYHIPRSVLARKYKLDSPLWQRAEESLEPARLS